MALEFIDLKGFLFLVLIAIPRTLSTNIDCGGKPFHCLNTTHFMICVDLGGGVSATIDDFIIPCPPTTVCQKDNRFECEFPKIEAPTTPLYIIGVSNGNERSDDDKTIPPDKTTIVMSLLEKQIITALPTTEKATTSLHNEILENLKDEFTGGNEKFFEEDIIPLTNIVTVSNSIGNINFVGPKIDETITTTDKYSNPKVNAETSSTNEVADAFGRDILILKDNVTFTEGLVVININNTSNKLNTTKEKDQKYINELNQTLDKFIEESELTTSLPNFSFKRSYNIDLAPYNLSLNDESYNLDLQQEVLNSVPVSENARNMTLDTLTTSETVLATASKYNGPDNVDIIIASKTNVNNLVTVKVNSTAINNSEEFITETVKKDGEYKDAFQSVTANPMEMTTTNFPVETSVTDLLNLTDAATSTEGLIIINKHDISHKQNTTEEIDQNYLAELNQTSYNFIKKLSSTTPLPYFSIERSYNINQDPVNVSDNLDLQQKVYNLAPIRGTLSETTIDTLSTTEKVLTTRSKYNDSDNVDYFIATEAVVNNSFTVKVNSTATNHSVESVTQILKNDNQYEEMFESMTVNPLEVTAANFSVEAPGTDIPKLENTVTFTDELIAINKHDPSKKHNKNEEFDQNYINELNQTSNKFAKKLDSSTSLSNLSIIGYNINQDLISISDNLELQQEGYNTNSISGTVSEMTIDTLSTTKPVLATSSAYNDHDNVDYVTPFEAVVNNSIPVKANGSVKNFIVKSITEILQKDDEHKDIFKSAPTFSTEITKVNSPLSLSYDLGTTNSNIIFAEMPSVMINRTSNSPDKHDTLQYTVPTYLSIKPVTQSILESLSTNEPSYTIQDLNGVMTTPHYTINDDNKISFKGNTEIKNIAETVSIFNDNTVNVVVDKTREDYFSAETDNIDQIITHNVKPTTTLTHSQISEIATTFRTTITNSNQTSVTEIPTTRTDEQLIYTGDNYKNNLNSFVENSIQGVQLQDSIPYFPSTIEKSTTIAPPLVNDFTSNTFNEISSVIETTTMIGVDFVQQESNHIINKNNVSMDVKVESNFSLPSTTPNNINRINDTQKNTQNITTVPHSEAVIYHGNSSNYNNTAIGKESDISSTEAEKNKTSKTIKNNYFIFIKSENGTNSSVNINHMVDSEAYQLSTPFNAYNINVELPNTFINLTEQTNFVQTDNISVLSRTPNTIKTESTTVSGLNIHPSIVEESEEKITVMQSMNFSTNLLSNKNEVKHTTIPMLTTVQNNMKPIVVEYTASFDLETVTRKKISSSSNANIAASGQVNASLLTGQNDDITVKPLESVTANIKLHKQNIKNIMETTTKQDSTTRYPLITESVTESIYSTNLSMGTPLSNGMANYVYPEDIHLVEYKENDKESNTITSRNIIYPGVLNSTANSLLDSNQPTRALTELVTDSNQDLLLPPDNENKKEHNITTSSVIDIIELRTAHGEDILLTTKEATTKKPPIIMVNRILPNMVAINQQNTDDLIKVGSSNVTQSTKQTIANDLDNISTLPTLMEDTAIKQLNITVNRILPSAMVSISQHNTDDFIKVGKQIVSSNVTQSTKQTVRMDLEGISILLAPKEATTRKQSNITVNGILLSTTDDLVKVGTQIVSPNVTQTTEQTISDDLDSISKLSTLNDTTTKKNILPVNMVPISQHNTDNLVKVGTQIVISNVTQSTQQIIGNNSGKTSFNIVTEPTTIVETINDTYKLIGRPILSDIILSDVKFTNGTASLKSILQFNSGKYKNATEKETLYEKLQNNTFVRNTSSYLNNREDLNLEVVNGTLIDRKINIELSGGTNDNENSAENYKFSRTYNKIAPQIEITSPGIPYNKSVNNIGYKSPLSTIDIGRQGNMSKNFSDLTQNATLLNKSKYIYNSTNGSRSIFEINKEQIDTGSKSTINRSEAKVNNLTEPTNIFYKRQVKQPNGSAESQTSNINISYISTNQISNISNLMSLVHFLASVNAYNPARTTNANKEENTTLTVDCLKLPRGKYADSKDCRKFYICVGKLQPVVGTCPNNTVFSEINKQCTRNLSHCVRNNQFHCLYEGRFSDFLRDNIYYICVKNNLNGFYRYKLQCQSGYHLNKTIVKCEKKNEILNSSEISLSNSYNVSNDRNRSMLKSDVSESSENSEFECKKEGKFPYSKDCTKFYVCTKNSKDEYRRKIKRCSKDEVYDKKEKKCVSDNSEEC